MNNIPDEIERRLHVNWADGMKISKNHFIQLERSFYSDLLNAYKLNLNDYNYGLFPSTAGKGKSLNIKISTQADVTSIQLIYCRAITKNGCIIDLSSEMVNTLQLSSNLECTVDARKTDTEYYLILKADPFKLIPVVEPDPNEIPPRHPYSIINYEFSAIPVSETNLNQLGLHFLCLGKVTCKEGEWKTDKSYIPPCLAINSYEVLQNSYDQLMKFLGSLRTLSFDIVKKKENPQTLTLAKNIKILAEKIAFFTGDILFASNKFFDQMPPVEIVRQVERLTNLKDSFLNCVSIADKESMLTYFNELFKEFKLDAIADLGYSHENIEGSFKKVIAFTEGLYNLLRELNAPPYLGGGRIRLDVKKQY